MARSQANATCTDRFPARRGIPVTASDDTHASTDQATTGARHAPVRIASRDATAIAAYQATRRAAASHGTTGIAIFDCPRAHIGTDQATNIVDARNSAGGKAAADAATITAHQGACSVTTDDRAARQTHIRDHTTAAEHAKQAHARSTRLGNIQIGNNMPGPIEAAREGRSHRADGNEACGAPDILTIGRRRGSAEAAAQGVVGRLIHRHQLQLVRRVDVRRPFGCQHRTRAGTSIERAVGTHRHPVVACGAARGREIEPYIITRYQHLSRAQSLGVRGSAIEALTDAIQTRVNRAVKIGAVDGAGIVLTDDGTDAGTAARDLASGIHISDGAAHVIADDPTCQRGGLHITRRIAVAQAAAQQPHQAADIAAGGSHLACRVAIGDGRAGAVIDTNQAASTACAVHRACRIAIANRGIINTDEAAAIVAACVNSARCIAIGDRARIGDNQAGRDVVRGACSGGTGTALDQAALSIEAHKAACCAIAARSNRTRNAAIDDRSCISAD